MNKATTVARGHEEPRSTSPTGRSSAVLTTARPDIARRLAENLHRDQRRKNGEAQYEHCRRVAERVEGAYEVTVAWLHDVLEDTGIDHSVLFGLFGPYIYADVAMLTRAETETYGEYIERIRLHASDEALNVKLADLEDNSQKRENDTREITSLRARYIKAHITLTEERNRRPGYVPLALVGGMPDGR